MDWIFGGSEASEKVEPSKPIDPARAHDLVSVGDVILCQTPAFVCQAQRFFTMSKWDHVGIITRIPMFPASKKNYCVLEAISDGVVITPLSARLEICARCNQEVALRKVHWEETDEALTKLDNLAKEAVGTPWSLWGLVVPGRTPVFREFAEGVYCSQLVVLAFKAMGLLPGDAEDRWLPGDFSTESVTNTFELMNARFGPEFHFSFGRKGFAGLMDEAERTMSDAQFLKEHSIFNLRRKNNKSEEISNYNCFYDLGRMDNSDDSGDEVQENADKKEEQSSFTNGGSMGVSAMCWEEIAIEVLKNGKRGPFQAETYGKKRIIGKVEKIGGKPREEVEKDSAVVVSGDEEEEVEYEPPSKRGPVIIEIENDYIEEFDDNPVGWSENRLGVSFYGRDNSEGNLSTSSNLTINYENSGADVASCSISSGSYASTIDDGNNVGDSEDSGSVEDSDSDSDVNASEAGEGASDDSGLR